MKATFCGYLFLFWGKRWLIQGICIEHPQFVARVISWSAGLIPGHLSFSPVSAREDIQTTLWIPILEALFGQQLFWVILDVFFLCLIQCTLVVLRWSFSGTILRFMKKISSFLSNHTNLGFLITYIKRYHCEPKTHLSVYSLDKMG